MERNIIINSIKDKIHESKSGQIYTLTDFLDIANYDAVRKALSRLTKSGELIRVLRGIYKVPNYNEFLQQEVPVSPDEIARAIAKERNWTIGPKGDAALNLLGLTTQVPAVYEYISDGPYKSIDYNGIMIKFSRRSNKNISGKTYKTILIIEALRTLGQEGVDNVVRNIIVHKCTREDFEQLLDDGKSCSRWIFEEIKEIVRAGGYKDVVFSK